jgi:hypothetical protein
MKTSENPTTTLLLHLLDCPDEVLTCLQGYEPEETFDLEECDNSKKQYTEVEIYTLIAELQECQRVIIRQQKTINNLQAVIEYLDC